ncbi:membrane protein insertion efficiency factor YidD [Desulfobacula sp.]
MLLRNNIFWNNSIYFIILLFLFFHWTIPSVQAENIVVKFYQENISPVDGDRCPMYPSCSVYASQAIEKHGLLIGWIMACDRLVRCGRDEVHKSKTIIASGRKLIYDPVEANDFWWFKKKE